ncbi:unnamed protein product [Prunus armeniaca]
MMMVMKRRIPTMMKAVASDVNERAMSVLVAQKVVNCPFHSALAVLIFVDGNQGGADVLTH